MLRTPQVGHHKFWIVGGVFCAYLNVLGLGIGFSPSGFPLLLCECKGLSLDPDNLTIRFSNYATAPTLKALTR
jgi:hypothetical protein